MITFHHFEKSHILYIISWESHTGGRLGKVQGSQAAFVSQVHLDHILVGADEDDKDDDHSDDDFDGDDEHEDGNNGHSA